MERVIFVCGSIALIGLGVCMIVWPGWVILNSREADDNKPPTSRELWTMRVVGVGTLLGGGYGVYAILTGMPGSDILTP